MLPWNFQPANVHLRGAHYLVESITENGLFLRSMHNRGKNMHFILPSVPFELSDDDSLLPGFSRTQFTVRACLAVTTSKVQGQSFNRALGIDWRHQCLTHRQLYVTLSRIMHPSKLAVGGTDDNRSTKNVIYRWVLSSVWIFYNFSKSSLAGLLSYSNCCLQKNKYMCSNIWNPIFGVLKCCGSQYNFWFGPHLSLYVILYRW